MSTPEVTRVKGGYRVRTVDGWHLDVRPMVRFYRAVEVSTSSVHVLGRFWCYQTFEAAVLAVAAWDGSADTEPVGWFRCGGARPDDLGGN